MATINANGGACLVQDPDEALFGGMPSNALAAVPAAKALPVTELAPALVELIGRPVPRPTAEPDAELIKLTDLAEQQQPLTDVKPPGVAVPIGCPDCRGGLNQIDTARTVFFRCHVGHAYSPQTLVAAQGEATESALWTAVSILEEQAAVHLTIAERVTDSHQTRHQEAAALAASAAIAIRNTIQDALTATR
jgi:two-component system, chemotaxis family, protein-glutamate methylesterase/glutaminase